MSGPLVTNASDEVQVKKAKARVKHSARERRMRLYRLCQDPDFHLFMWHWLGDAKCMFGSPYAKDPTDAYFNMGKQSLGNAMMAELTSADPHFFARMQATATEPPASGPNDDIENEQE